jgi:hypothetical protein
MKLVAFGLFCVIVKEAFSLSCDTPCGPVCVSPPTSIHLSNMLENRAVEAPLGLLFFLILQTPPGRAKYTLSRGTII